MYVGVNKTRGQNAALDVYGVAGLSGTFADCGNFAPGHRHRLQAVQKFVTGPNPGIFQ
jgi:hypothetical protein